MENPASVLAKRFLGEELPESYFSSELGAGQRVVFTDPSVFGRPANLLAVTAEEESSIRLNTGMEIGMKRDEGFVMINAMRIYRLEVLEGRVRVFSTIVPEWMPALFWTRSVTVLGVADAVREALAGYGAATEATLESVKSILDNLRFDQESSLQVYQPSVWRTMQKLYDASVASGDEWGVAGNMVAMYRSLSVDGEYVVLDDAEVVVP